MTHFLVLLLALLIGVIAGLRAFSAPAAVAWAAALHWINMDGTWASWMGNWFVVALFTVLALGRGRMLAAKQLQKRLGGSVLRAANGATGVHLSDLAVPRIFDGLAESELFAPATHNMIS